MTYITIQDAQRILDGCSPQYIYRLLRQGKIILTKESVEMYKKNRKHRGRPKIYGV